MQSMLEKMNPNLNLYLHFSPELIQSYNSTIKTVETKADGETNRCNNVDSFQNKLQTIYNHFNKTKLFNNSIVDNDFNNIVEDIKKKLITLDDKNPLQIFTDMENSLSNCSRYLNSQIQDGDVYVAADCSTLETTLNSFYAALNGAGSNDGLLDGANAKAEYLSGNMYTLFNAYVKMYYEGTKVFVSYKSLYEPDLKLNFFQKFGRDWDSLLDQASEEIYICSMGGIIKEDIKSMLKDISGYPPQWIANQSLNYLTSNYGARYAFVLVLPNTTKGVGYAISGLNEMQIDNQVVAMTFSTFGESNEDLLTATCIQCYLSRTGCLQSEYLPAFDTQTVLRDYHRNHIAANPVVILRLYIHFYLSATDDLKVLWTNCSQNGLITAVLSDNDGGDIVNDVSAALAFKASVMLVALSSLFLAVSFPR